MIKWKSRRFIFLTIALLSAVFVLVIYYYDPALLKGVDLKIQDVRFKLRGRFSPDPNIVIVAIDQKSINELGRWPWSRKIMAKLINALSSYGVKVIAVDIVFSERSDPEDDIELAKAIKMAGNVILGYFFRYSEEQAEPDSIKALRNYKLSAFRFVGKEIKEVPVPFFPFAELNISTISKNAKGFGFFNIFPDKDGICRKYNLIAIYGEDFYPSLALASAKELFIQEPVITLAPYGVDSIIVGNKRIVVDEMGRCVINYYTDTFPVISAVDVIKKRVSLDKLKNKVVFVGATEIGIYDLRATPIDPVLPGVLIHATVLSNILQEKFIIRDSRVISLEVFFIIFLPLFLSLLLSLVRHTLFSVIFLFGSLLCYGLINIGLFSRYGLNLSMIYPALSILSNYIGCEAYRNFIEVKRSKFLQRAFSSYISPELVSQIVKNPDMLKLGGEKREITVLFSDIRGFTTISEKFPPETIVQILNKYLDPMTKIVLSHKGTLDKYIGDAIMAIYNAPLDIEDHPYLACKSALEMIKALKDVNREFKNIGFPEIDIGVGIHTGYAVVGNMGTDVRFDYTAIGDTVNLSSRLESLNKQYGTHIIVSEETRNRVKDGAFKFRELDRIRVKGKEVPVTIYELSLELDDELIEMFEKALLLYRRGDFEDALRLFSILEKDFNDPVSKVFSARCKEFIISPPPKEWDGVYVARSK